MKKEIVIPSKIENISIIEKLVDELSETLKFSSEVYGNLLVAVIEGVNNAILHGNKLDETKKVVINYLAENNILTFSIKDEGKGFDYKKLPDPTHPDNIEKPHGRGVFLMRNLADEILFNETGSEITLKFKLSGN